MERRRAKAMWEKINYLEVPGDNATRRETDYHEVPQDKAAQQKKVQC